MHPAKTKSLFRSNLIVAILYMLILLLLAYNLPSTETMWSDSDWASEQIQKAKTSDQMLPVFQMATHRFNTTVHLKNALFGVAWFTGLAFCLFIFLNAFSIRRLERQLSSRDPQN